LDATVHGRLKRSGVQSSVSSEEREIAAPERGDQVRTKSKLVLAAIIVVGLAVAAGLFLHTAIFRDYILSEARRHLIASEGIELGVGSLQFSLSRLTVHLENVALRSAAAPGLPPFLAADSVHAVFGLSGLVHGSLSIRDARLNRMSLRIVIDEKGTSNLPEAATRGKATPGAGLAGFNLLPSQLRIDGGSILVEDQPRRVRVALPLGQFSMERSSASAGYNVH